jgi:transaldolase/glucose-6-phosphate isomerase
VLGAILGRPRLIALDSTDPDQIRAVEARIDPARTLFIVSSKSGGTLEPNILKDYFFAPARRFIAITDPGSALERAARRDGFHRVVLGEPGIGGRYSVLSPFGLVPAAAAGIDVAGFLRAARHMVLSCGPAVPPAANPGVALGAILGVAARQGRDKVTILADPPLAAFGAWAEQLLAESTGKSGRGLVPVDGEAPGEPSRYGADRIFVHLGLAGTAPPAALAALEAAGQPVVRLTLAEPAQLGQEFFRWEMATAVASAILGVHAFDQPDVEASKIETRKLTDAFEATGDWPPDTPLFEEDGIKVFADPANAAAIGAGGLDAALAAHFARLSPGDYAAFLAYLPRDAATIEALAAMRLLVRDARRVATCVGFGPRFLHSTGQAYKGGPDSGVFLQLTAERARELPVPGRRYGFAGVEAAQARGDFDVLAARGRRLLRVHLGTEFRRDLDRLTAAIRRAMR